MNERRKILIAGAGVAGASLAIRLAMVGVDVTLIERDKFPRHKLCGEFVSPESLVHFREMGVLDEMLAIGGERINETVFYSTRGRSVSVPSGWFENGTLGALSISRANMDLCLLNKAKQLGVNVLDETTVTKTITESGRINAVKLRNKNGEAFETQADIFIDATGRARILSKQFSSEKNKRAEIVAFKAHLKNTDVPPGVCEIYSFRGGYGGLSLVEEGAANCCFIMRADVVKKYGNDVDEVFREVVLKNPRARLMMKDAEPMFDWIAVSIDSFGAKDLVPAENLFAAGDAAAFIDPFTGSGMLMALESSEILSECLTQTDLTVAEVAQKYRAAHERRFRRRLAICRIMRGAAFSTRVATATIFVLGLNKSVRHFLTRNTRTSDPRPTHNLPL